MLRVCEKLRKADARRKSLGLVHVRTETEYLRALLDAMANMDRLVEVEVLKSLGDVNLEKGKLGKDKVNFDRAMIMYRTALLRCEDESVGESFGNRYRSAEKLRVGKTTLISYEPSTSANKTPSLAMMAEKFRHLDRRLTFDYRKESLLIEYTKLMVEGIANEDGMFEVEAIKSLGDVYLKRGTETRDTTCFTKAAALYNTALSRCEGMQGTSVLIHRVLYTARLRQEIRRKRTLTGQQAPNRRRQRQQQGDVMADFRVKSVNTDVISHATGQQSMSYEDGLAAGDRALTDGKLHVAEEKFASSLRMIHDRNKPIRDKEAECLRRLGDVYVQRGKRTKEGRKFTQAAALYNAAMARTDRDKQKIVKRLQDTEKWFLQHTANVERKPIPHNSNKRHQRQLEDMRVRAKLQLDVIDQQHNPYQYDDDNPMMLALEAERAEAIKALFKSITKDRQRFIQEVVDECIATLGAPPCKYAFIGLGSQATELVTPYSDLEFAILIEDGKDNDVTRRYFLDLTHYLHLKVINLGETILPAMAIPSLNDFYSDNADKTSDKNWFFDSITSRGFSFDGFMPWACKTPFGRDKTKTKQPLSLIQTPAKMAVFQQLEVSMAEGYHLSDILRRIVLLAGEEALVNEYRKKLNKMITNDLLSHIQSRLSAMQIIAENKEMLTSFEPTGQMLNVKKDIYRFPGIAIEILSLCCHDQITRASTWAVIDRLKETGRIKEEDATHLTVLTSISAELRLRTYMANRGQKDSLSPLVEMKYETKMHQISDATLKSEFHIPDTQILYRYYYRAIPLKKCIPDIVQDVSKGQSRIVFKSTIFDISNKCRGRIAKNLFHSSKCIHHFEAALKDAGSDMVSRSGILIELGEYLAVHGDIKKSKDYFEESLRMQKTIYGDTANPITAASFHSLGLSWGILGDPKKAICYFEQSLKMAKTLYDDKRPRPDIAVTLSNLGLCWSDLGDEEKAISYHEESLMMRKNMYGYTPHEHISNSLLHLGGSWSKLGDETKAISYYERSLTMANTIYGQNAVHPQIAATLNNLGLSYSNLGNQQKALSYHERSLMIKEAIYGKNTCHQDIATSLHNVGFAWYNLGNHEEAISYYERALKMSTAIYGEKAAHLQIATALNNLGISWSELGDHGKSISYLNQSIAMRRKVAHGDDTPDPKTAKALQNLGMSWKELHDEKKAMSYFEQSLSMWKAIYGDNTAHSEIILLLGNIGSSWNDLGDQRKAIKYFQQSQRTAKTLYGDDTAHEAIAASLKQLGLSWRKLGVHKKAISYFEQSLRMEKTIYGGNTTHPHIAWLLRNIGSSWTQLGDQKKAISCYEQSLTIEKTIRGPNTADLHLARILDTLGTLWSELGDERKAISYFDETLSMMKTIHGHTTPHQDIATTLNKLGNSWSRFGNDRKAISYYEQSIAMCKAINTADANISGILHNLGMCWKEIGDEKKAIHYFEQSLTMWKTRYGYNTPHQDIATTLNELGNSWGRLGDDRKAVSYYEQSIGMWKTINGPNTADADIAGTLHNLGVHWSKLDNKKKAIGYFQRSLMMRKTIYGDSMEHPDIAMSLRCLGSSWRKLGDHKRAIGYLEQSLTMMKTFYGNNTAYVHIASLLHELGSVWNEFGNHQKAVGYFEQALTMGNNFYGHNTAHPYIAMTHGYLAFSWSELGDQTKAISYLEQSRRMVEIIYGDNPDPNIVALLQSTRINME